MHCGSHALLRSLADPAWLVDGVSLRVVAANDAAEALLGLAPGALPGHEADAVLGTLEDATYWQQVRAQAPSARATKEPTSLDSQTTLPCGDGTERILRRSITPVASDVQVDFLVVVRDCTAQHRADQEREALLSELCATLESTADGILVTDLRGHVRAFNRRFAALWQLPESLLGTGKDVALQEWMRNSVAEPIPYARRLAEIEANALLTATDPVQLFSGAVLERHTQPQLCRGEATGRVFSFRPMQAGTAALADAQAANELPIGLPSRPGFVRQVNEALTQARRGGGAVAVLCVEFDGRAIYGLDGARMDSERLWRDIGESIRGCVRHPDIVARIGSTRFAVLAHHIGEAGAETLARRILGSMGRRLGQDVNLGALPVSAGVALYPDAGTTGSELLDHAHIALALAQASPGEGHRIYRVADDPSRTEDRIADALRRALRDSRLRVQFQPCVDLASGRVIGAEGLLRWRDAGLGDVAPARTVAAAESCGLIVGIDEWVLERTVRQAAAWRADGNVMRVAANVASATLLRPAFARRVKGLLADTGLPAACLDIEFREQALLADPKSAQESMAELGRLGVGLVLDDFGSGASSIGHLREYPFRALKIDRTLARDVPHHVAHAGMVEGLSLLARALRIEVIAKGIETEAQQRFFRDIGCTSGQGFLFGQALTPESFQQRLPARAA